MVAVSGYAIMKGDPARILVPFDSDGNECGRPLQDKSANLGTRDFTDYKYKYFTGLLKTATGNLNDQYHAICVKECPSGAPSVSAFDLSSAVRLDCLKNDEVAKCPYM
jgi:hypothetical protein